MNEIATDAKRPDHLDGCAKSWSEVKSLLSEDLYRYAGSTSVSQAVKHYLFTPGFKYTCWMRTTGRLRRGSISKLTLFPLAKLILLHLRYKFGIAIPENTVIGGGLFINRFGGIYIHNDAVIGRNCNITPGVLLGQVNRGSKAGAPILGDRVFLASGAKVIGKVTIGDDAAIGVNALVTTDVPPMGVMAAPQATMISQRGSSAYINRQA